METDITLYPSEEVIIQKIVGEVWQQFMGKSNSAQNLRAMGEILTERMLKEAGLICSFDPDHLDLGPDGLTLVTSPHLVIEGRAKAESHDHDRHRYEALRGMGLDGQGGEMQVDGTIKEV